MTCDTPLQMQNIVKQLLTELVSLMKEIKAFSNALSFK